MQTPKLMKYYLAVKSEALRSLERLQKSFSMECGCVSWKTDFKFSFLSAYALDAQTLLSTKYFSSRNS